MDGKLDLFCSTTDDNGHRHEVLVRPAGEVLAVTENGVRKLFPQVNLVATLWNPATIHQSRLIDPVNGKVRRVTITDRGLEIVSAQGVPVQARHVSIAGTIRREVWYAPDRRIVHFEFRVGDGSLIAAQLR